MLSVRRCATTGAEVRFGLSSYLEILSIILFGVQCIGFPGR